jgi:hypothetical protein
MASNTMLDEKELTHRLAVEFCCRRNAEHIREPQPFPCGACCGDAERFLAAAPHGLPAPSATREELEAAIDRYGIAAQELSPDPDETGRAQEYDAARAHLLALIFPTPAVPAPEGTNDG